MSIYKDDLFTIKIDFKKGLSMKELLKISENLNLDAN
jgi:hypothetical protein